ncbi:MAG: VCBS repeat-containing protein [Thermoguttaceae bacterium]
MMRRFLTGVFAWVVATCMAMAALADEVFEKPVRLQADGTVIDTGSKAWAHSSPCMEDLDGDGLKDLIVGDFSGKFHVYKNVGKPNAPVFHDIGKLQAGGKDASVRIYCCIGAQPRFVDLDGDGIRDFISNSYDPGHCYFFRGLPDHKFAAGVELLDKNGVPVRSSPKQKQNFQSFGSFFTPVDWNGNGVYSLLIGCFEGHLKLRINEGTAKKAVFAEENQDVLADGQPIQVARHCCPVVADWDGDGLWDLIVSSEDGGVVWYRNVGDRHAPKFAKAVTLVKKCDGNGFDRIQWSDDDIKPGVRVQIEVADLNGDGKIDLLLGDFYSVYEPKKDLTEGQKTRLKKLLADLDSCNKPWAEKFKSFKKEFSKRYPGDASFGDKATVEWRKAYTALQDSPEAKDCKKREKELCQQIRPLLAKTRHDGDESYYLQIPHGYVWLFLRK